MKLPIHYTDFDMDPPSHVWEGAYQMKKYCSDLSVLIDFFKTRVSNPIDVYYAQSYNSIKQIVEGIQKILKDAEAELNELCISIPEVVERIEGYRNQSPFEELRRIGLIK